MRILWVKIGSLYPLNSGGRLRSYHILRELSRRHAVTYLCTVESLEESEPLRVLLQDCEAVETVQLLSAKRSTARFYRAAARSLFSPLPVDLFKHRSEALRERVREMAAKGSFDVIVGDFLHSMVNIPADLPAPVVLFEHNVEYMIWKRLAEREVNPVKRLVLALEWRKMRRYEERRCRAVACCVAVSETDARLLCRGGAGSVRTIPTGVDLDFFKPFETSPQDTFGLVFTGSMDWFPNEDAILYFLDKIQPLIKEQVPQATLTVVGRNPSRRLREAAAQRGVHLTGLVDDIRPYVAKAAVYVVPLRVGGGTRLKIFEALAMGKPVVSTTIGAEGLPLVPGEHFLLADTPVEFAEAVVRLLGDGELHRRLGRNGRELVESKYGWPSVAESFETILQEVIYAR